MYKLIISGAVDTTDLADTRWSRSDFLKGWDAWCHGERLQGATVGFGVGWLCADAKESGAPRKGADKACDEFFTALAEIRATSEA